MKSYSVISYNIFGGIVESVKEYFLDIREDIHRAGINYTIEEYLSVAFMTTSMTFVIETAIFSFILGILGIGIFASIAIALTVSLGVSGALFFLFYSYPATISKTRESGIKKSLPFAISYLAAMSSAKLPFSVIFKELSEFKKYGKVSREFKRISKDIEILGMTTSAAIKRRARRTPSKDMREILWGINTIITSGGDLTMFLKQKGDELMSNYRRSIRTYAQNLSLYTEIYLTLIISGSIFFIVLSSIISSISGGFETTLIQGGIVFVLLPVLSIFFIILMKSISPLE